MSDILDFYEEQIQSISQVPWLAELKRSALADFKQYGFPSRRDEEWKYTPLDRFLQQRFYSSNVAKQSLASSALDNRSPLDAHCTIHNGHVYLNEPLLKQLPAGVMIQSLADALQGEPEKLRPYLGQLLKHEHGFHALNTATLSTGVLVYLQKGLCLDTPLVLAHWQDNNEQAIHGRYLIIAEEGSEASIVETFQGDDKASYLTNVVTEVWLQPRAKLIHYTVQCESRAAYHIGHMAIEQKAASHYENHAIQLGGALVRRSLSVNLDGPKAACLLNGIYIPSDKQHIDQHTTIHHAVMDCSSDQDYKGILTGSSRAVFNGKVIVNQQAQHTKASQENKNLLLSPLAEVNTKPQLDIFADDVSCSHGATVGQLDEEALFYLATRGIDRAEAIPYLIHAFAADNLRLISHSVLKTWIANLINQQLRAS